MTNSFYDKPQNRNKKDRPTPPVLQNGIAFIILLFLVLSLVSFAALSLSSARADEKLTAKYTSQLTDYYAARNAAEEALLAYDEARARGGTAEATGLAGSAVPAGSSVSSESAVTADSASADLATDSATASDSLITARYSISDTQDLVITIEPLAESEGGHYYRLLAETVVNTEDYEIDNSIEVFDPDSIDEE